ncbi:MAG: hypothetical protein DDT27_01387 [Dehalococcoidia bacterium]|nr:hypothetical protein [Chloroflexota bacterium]
MNKKIMLIPLALLLTMSLILAGCPAPVRVAVANLAMQVNPALQLSLDREHKVIGVEGLDEDGKALLAQLDVQNKELRQALQEIIDVLMDGGFLTPEVRVVIVLHPIDVRVEEDLPHLSAIAHQAVTGRLVEIGVQIKVVSQVITEDLYENAIEEGLLPADYIDLIEAGVSADSIKSIIGLGKELHIEQELFLEEFDTTASAMIDMVEAGITEEAAVALLKAALKADPSLEEVTTITAGIVDMHEAGLNPEQVLALLALHKELADLGIAIAPETFLEEFSTIVAAMIDMTDAGITEADAMAMIREALKADPSLEEVTTITAGIVDMHEAELTPEYSLAVLRLHKELGVLGIAPETFLEEFSTIVAAMIDMAEAGIRGDAAMAMIREAMKADPSLEEVAIIIAAEIDLVDEQQVPPPDEQQVPPAEQQVPPPDEQQVPPAEQQEPPPAEQQEP